MPVIHNKGRAIGEKNVARKIIFPKGWDENGQPLRDGKSILTETLMPGAHKNVSAEQLKHLKENFGPEIVNIEDIGEMKAQFKEKEPEKPREGYVSPDEVNKLVEKRAAELLAEREKEEKSKEVMTREELINYIDKADRAELIAFIEKNDLGIEHKNMRAAGTLQAAILAAMEAKTAGVENAE